MNKIIEKEIELYKPVKDLLEIKGFKVKGEVGDCDVYAVKDNIILVVELKKTISLALLTQAVQRQKVSDIVYIAVPTPKKSLNTSKWKNLIYLIKRLELGLMFVSNINGKYIPNIALEPKYFNDKMFFSREEIKRKKLLDEFNKRNLNTNLGGTKGKIITAYREFAINVAIYIIENGSTSVKILAKEGFDKKKLNSIFYKNYYGWFERVERGVYNITEKGKKEVNDFINF